MYIEIISPETILFSGEIQSITVPGKKGYLQILNQHAPIVSTLTKGKVKIQGELNLSEEVREKIILDLQIVLLRTGLTSEIKPILMGQISNSNGLDP